MWKCQKCEEEFDEHVGLQRHRRQSRQCRGEITRELNPRQALRCEVCFVCNEIYKSRVYLNSHEEVNHPDQRIFCFFCCEHTLVPRDDNCSHNRTHHPFLKKCKIWGCDAYRYAGDMEHHLQICHKEVYECDLCEFRVERKNWKNIMIVHLAKNHFPREVCAKKPNKCQTREDSASGEAKEKSCTSCGSAFKVHDYHNHIKERACARCEEVFKCFGRFQEHTKSCLVHRFRCEECPKTFMFPSKLNYHVKRKHGEKRRDFHYQNLGHKCNTCGTFYKSKNSLKRHISCYHNEARKKQCPHCPKKFLSLHLLENHLAMAHNLIECKFKCAECEKKFFSQSFLKHHTKSTHEADKTKVKCPICENEMQANYLKEHMKNKH